MPLCDDCDECLVYRNVILIFREAAEYRKVDTTRLEYLEQALQDIYSNVNTRFKHIQLLLKCTLFLFRVIRWDPYAPKGEGDHGLPLVPDNVSYCQQGCLCALVICDALKRVAETKLSTPHGVANILLLAKVNCPYGDNCKLAESVLLFVQHYVMELSLFEIRRMQDLGQPIDQFKASSDSCALVKGLIDHVDRCSTRIGMIGGFSIPKCQHALARLLCELRQFQVVNARLLPLIDELMETTVHWTPSTVKREYDEEMAGPLVIETATIAVSFVRNKRNAPTSEDVAKLESLVALTESALQSITTEEAFVYDLVDATLRYLHMSVIAMRTMTILTPDLFEEAVPSRTPPSKDSRKRRSPSIPKTPEHSILRDLLMEADEPELKRARVVKDDEIEDPRPPLSSLSENSLSVVQELNNLLIAFPSPPLSDEEPLAEAIGGGLRALLEDDSD